MSSAGGHRVNAGGEHPRLRDGALVGRLNRIRQQRQQFGHIAPHEALLAAALGEYGAASGALISLEAAGGVEVARRIEAGEPADIVVLAADAIEKLVKLGRLCQPRDFLSSGVAIGVPRGAAVPNLGDEAAVKQAVLAATSISYSTGPSGRYLESLFERWGILDAIRPRLVVPPPGVSVASLIGTGAGMLGFQQLSEMQDVPGVHVAGPLPAGVQQVTIFTGAVSTASCEAAAADEFLRFLAAPAREALKQRFGMAGT